MTTVYVVTRGAYSDYHIMGLFSEKPAAEQWAQRWDGRVEEYKLDSLAPYTEMSIYRMEMLRDGTIMGISQYDDFAIPYARVLNLRHGDHVCPTLYIRCFARDEQHAIKIANEKRTQLIASGGWANIERPSERNT